MKKIVVIGPESTGKSTLCAQLAKHYSTTWCPEFAREYLSTNGKDYSYHDLLAIAEGQLATEDNYLDKAKSGMYFIDTNMYVMKVWCEYVYGKCHQFILDQLVARQYDLYLLCDIDLPWTFDELREYPDEHSRRELFCIYEDIMINQSTPWALISGSYDERTSKAIDAVQRVI
jgi:NadR type nicotinamide-nucleotide adenylyltransferase